MKLRFLAALAVTALSMSAISSALADDSKAYTEGTVVEVTSIRTKPGMFDAYMKWLDTTGKQLREDEKKAGLILDYAVYQALPRSPHDPDIYLVITYKNMAALDGLSDRVEPLQRKIWATREAGAKAAADRESMREILGTELMRKLELK
ncbi:MAG TPA: hypothetical protein VNX69_06625 [Steroidobacteraceae bacterium]|nr:hypothetical protein [Steroidobacteraceae bacterium]